MPEAKYQVLVNLSEKDFQKLKRIANKLTVKYGIAVTRTAALRLLIEQTPE
jgi:hypothetical protein